MRILIVASMIGLYALGFVPEEWGGAMPLVSRVLAVLVLIGVLANYIYDGEAEDEGGLAPTPRSGPPNSPLLLGGSQEPSDNSVD
jgi:hypothetical protein